MSKYIKCPRCGCKDLFIIEDNRNDFYAGLGGYLLTHSILEHYHLLIIRKAYSSAQAAARSLKRFGKNVLTFGAKQGIILIIIKIKESTVRRLNSR